MQSDIYTSKVCISKTRAERTDKGPGWIMPVITGPLKFCFNALAWPVYAILGRNNSCFTTSKLRESFMTLVLDSSIRYSAEIPAKMKYEKQDTDKIYDVFEDSWQGLAEMGGPTHIMETAAMGIYRGDPIFYSKKHTKDEALDILAQQEEMLFRQFVENKLGITESNSSEMTRSGKLAYAFIKAQFVWAGFFTPGHVSHYRSIDYSLQQVVSGKKETTALSDKGYVQSICDEYQALADNALDHAAKIENLDIDGAKLRDAVGAMVSLLSSSDRRMVNTHAAIVPKVRLQTLCEILERHAALPALDEHAAADLRECYENVVRVINKSLKGVSAPNLLDATVGREVLLNQTRTPVGFPSL